LHVLYKKIDAIFYEISYALCLAAIVSFLLNERLVRYAFRVGVKGRAPRSFNLITGVLIFNKLNFTKSSKYHLLCDECYQKKREEFAPFLDDDSKPQ